jgi:DNA-binding NarL/FixJ family response regulator
VIADYYTMVRDALRLVLESEGRLSVVGEASDGDEATRRVRATGPDVLLLDFMMPRVVDGLDALRLLRKHGETSVRTVVLTEAITGTEVVTALQLGAHGVLLKSAMPSVLFECVRAVARGEFWLDSDGIHALARAFDIARATMEPPAARAQTLTARECQIIAAVIAGARNRDVSVRVNISKDTVKRDLSSVFRKLGVSSRLELAMCAVHHLAPRLQPESRA